MIFRSRRVLLSLACLTAALTSSLSYSVVSPDVYPDPLYYGHFRYSASRFLPTLPDGWKRLTAQGLAESNLDTNAVSPAGAVGVMQFMPRTWDDCLNALGLHHLTPRTYAKANIICGGWYMGVQMRIWRGRDRTPLEQWPLALAGYNGGALHVLRAQKSSDCLNGKEWKDLERCHPFKETRDYVARIQRIYDRMKI